jgi:hypothetical protein
VSDTFTVFDKKKTVFLQESSDFIKPKHRMPSRHPMLEDIKEKR